MKIYMRNFIYGTIVCVIGILLVYSILNPSFVAKLWNFISDNTIALLASAFLGGFSAGLFSYYFNSQSRLKELRHTKYFEHRNTIVQIEHELIGARASLSRNLESIKVALEAKKDRYRFILRFFNLDISSGLSLKLLDLNFINKYSEVYIIFKSINSDVEYLQGMVEQIQLKIDVDEPKPTPAVISQMNNYMTMLEHVYNQSLIADQMSLELVAMCKISLAEKPEHKLKEYINKGGEIKYSILKADIDKKITTISEEENRPGTEANPRPKFIALYFDLVKVTVTTPAI